MEALHRAIGRINLKDERCKRKSTRMNETLQHFQVVLFDFDGTLADSYAAITASVNHVREHYGKSALVVDEVKCHVGRGAEYLLTCTVSGGDLNEDLKCYRVHHPNV